MSQPSKLTPALYGGLAIGVLSAVPVLNLINCACCAGTILGGMLAVYLYRQQLDGSLPIQMGDGALLGLMAGIFGALLGSALTAIIGGFSMEYLQKLLETLDNPELNQVLEQFGPDFFAKGIFIAAFITSLIADAIFGLIGGLIGVSLFGKPSRPMTPPWQQPPTQP
jgi:hypothetical protein